MVGDHRHALAFVSLRGVAQAQQPAKVPRIGFLAAGGDALPEAFVKALANLGYANEKNITFEYRSRDGRPERDRDLAAELVRLEG